MKVNREARIARMKLNACPPFIIGWKFPYKGFIICTINNVSTSQAVRRQMKTRLV
jgi:hypothetical protein